MVALCVAMMESRVDLQLFLRLVRRGETTCKSIQFLPLATLRKDGETHARQTLNFMPTENTYVALPLDPPTLTNYPPAPPPAQTRSQSTDVAAIPRTKWRSTFSRAREIIESNAGLLLIVAAQAFLSLVNVAVKKLHSIDPPVSTTQIITVRMGITYACCIIYMLSAGVPDPFLGPKGVRTLLICRGISGFFGLFGIYYSLQYLSLSDATVLTFLVPLCTAIAGSLLLNEKFSAREALAGIFSLFGVILIAKPAFIFGTSSQGGALTGDIVSVVVEKSTSSQRLVAVGVALVGVLGGTGAYIFIRTIVKQVHPLHSLTSLSIQCVIVSTTYMITTKSPFVIPTRLDWLGLLMLIGVFGFIAQILLATGLQRETASRGSLALYTQVIFSTIFERIFFKSIPSALSVCGTLIILTSAFYVILTKKKDSNAVVLNQPDEQALEEGLLENRSVEPEEPIVEDKQPTTHNSIELRSIRT
ncbi:hypothetical protein BD779DRAFT_899798 [Infundibulicybe gibba]|nr:hypothetical protein BD779DRAFT_899798 [Infundibulicybe gibba]